MANLAETYRRFLGVGACAISPIADTTKVMSFPRLSALSLADNFEEGKIIANTETGISAVFNTYMMSHQPELSLTYSSFNIEMQAVASGWMTETLSDFEAPFVRQVVVPDILTDPYVFQAYTVNGGSGHTYDSNIGFKATKQENGVTVDVSSTITVSNNGEVTVPVTMAGEALTIEIFGSYGGGSITVSKPLGNVSITANMVTSDNKNVFLYVPVAKVNTTGNSFDPAADNKEIKFSLLSTGGCDPYKLLEVPMGVTCA